MALLTFAGRQVRIRPGRGWRGASAAVHGQLQPPSTKPTPLHLHAAAGLDWQARQEVVELLARLKKECTLLVVSHDLREVAPLVDAAWSMQLGGTMEPVEWPPAGGVGSLASAAAQLQRR